MATYRSGKGQRGGDGKKRDAWLGPREYNRSGSSSPGSRRSNSPWRFKPEHKENRENPHRAYVNFLDNEWRKVEHDLKKDQRIAGTVEYIEKTPTYLKAEELCNVELVLKNREEKPASPD